MAVVLMREKFKAISVTQLYFLETQPSKAHSCTSPSIKRSKPCFHERFHLKPGKLDEAPKDQTDLLTGGKRKNTSRGLKSWPEHVSRTQSGRRGRQQAPFKWLDPSLGRTLTRRASIQAGNLSIPI